MSDGKKPVKGKKLYNNPELDGFEEVIDLISPGAKVRRKGAGGNAPNKKFRENFSVLNLLESEKKRLSKVCDLFFEKLPNKKHYSQTNKLIQKQHAYRDFVKEKLVTEMRDEYSDYSRNTQSFFDHCF